MLYLMRKHAGSLLIKIILGAIVIVFVFWGIGSFRERQAGRVAVVNGEPISVAEYRETYNNLIQRLRASFGDNLDEAMIEQLKVKEQALNQLIEERLLLQEAQRLHLSVSESELADTIRAIPAFQSDSGFDPRLYRRILDLNRMTPETFEMLQKRSLQVQRLERFVTDGIHVSDLEVNAWIDWQNTAVNIRYVLFDPDAYTDITPSTEALEAFFKENASGYRTKEEVKVRYVHFDPQHYLNDVSVTEAELKEYYDANTEAFEVPKTMEARHILIKIDPADKPETIEEKRKKIEGLLKRIRNGEDFATLARAFSEDPSKASGGRIGPFQKEMMVPPFGEAAFALKAGEVSDPVRTRFGWHIIKAEKVNEAGTLSFSETKEEIRKKLLEDRAKTRAYEAAEAFYDRLIAGSEFEKAAEELKFELVTTDFFTREAPPAGPTDPAAFAAAAFALQAGEISDIQEMKDGYYILQGVEKSPPRTPEFETVSDRVRKDWIRKTQWEKAQTDAEAFLAAVKDNAAFEDQARRRQLPVNVTGFFKRDAPIPQIGTVPELTQAAFELTPEQPVPSKAIRGEKGYFVIGLVGKKIIPSADAAAEKEKARELIGRQKQLLAFNTIVSRLKNKAEIFMEEGFSGQ
ncbi:MAG: SurA N-terminal domain-containing protein [Deltaproteobacteria bacterium]|nr:SurA N-terminal domain-containing protein [Deltaproteobacteria bacterium]MBW2041774.1 SurA N-terminal domain-containing protein [Deltaproteobacteria bacterium]MBW2132115.1 SurA N-terminal domain-containing protein [Deltaproteobacteria bacterium]